MQALYLPSSYLSIHSSIFSLIICVTLHVTKCPPSISACPSTSRICLSIHPLFLPPSIQPSLHCIYPYIPSVFSPPHSRSHMQMTLPSWEHPSIRGDISGCHDAQEWFDWQVMGGDRGRCSYTPQGTGRPASEGCPAPEGSGAEAEKACPGVTVWLPLYLLILSVSLLSLCVCLVCVST